MNQTECVPSSTEATQDECDHHLARMAFSEMGNLINSPPMMKFSA